MVEERQTAHRRLLLHRHHAVHLACIARLTRIACIARSTRLLHTRSLAAALLFLYASHASSTPTVDGEQSAEEERALGQLPQRPVREGQLAQVAAERFVAQRAVHSKGLAAEQAPLAYEQLDALADARQVLRVQRQQRAGIAAHGADQECQQQQALAVAQGALQRHDAAHQETARNGERLRGALRQEGGVEHDLGVYASQIKGRETGGLEDGDNLLQNGVVRGKQGGQRKEQEGSHSAHLALDLLLSRLVRSLDAQRVLRNCGLSVRTQNDGKPE